MSREKLRRIADLLGYNIKQLSEATGYQRQSLYLIADNKHKNNKNRAKAAVRALRLTVEAEYRQKLNDLEMMHDRQQQACDAFERMVLKEEQNVDTNN